MDLGQWQDYTSPSQNETDQGTTKVIYKYIETCLSLKFKIYVNSYSLTYEQDPINSATNVVIAYNGIPLPTKEKDSYPTITDSTNDRHIIA